MRPRVEIRDEERVGTGGNVLAYTAWTGSRICFHFYTRHGPCLTQHMSHTLSTQHTQGVLWNQPTILRGSRFLKNLLLLAKLKRPVPIFAYIDIPFAAAEKLCIIVAVLSKDRYFVLQIKRLQWPRVAQAHISWVLRKPRQRHCQRLARACKYFPQPPPTIGSMNGESLLLCESGCERNTLRAVNILSIAALNHLNIFLICTILL